MMLKHTLTLVLIVLLGVGAGIPSVGAQAVEAGEVVQAATTETAAQPARPAGGGNFFDVVRGGGVMGIILWMALFGALFAGVWFIVDCAIFVRISRIIPQRLIDSVSESMAQGDVGKAIEDCDREPGPLANILKAGFSHVEEGFETIQDAVGVAAEMESESLMQRISYLSVVGNLSPMLGLLGTVQGMIYAFATLATESGAAQTGVLAMNISQALYTTAAGLSIAVPAVTAFFIFRNRASKIILRMEAMTLDLIKDLRNVEVVEE